MFKFLHEWWLEVRVANIAKLAEQHSESGVEPGSEVYGKLLEEANLLIWKHQVRYTDYDVTIKMPVMVHLKQLATKKEQPPVADKIALVVGIAIGSAVLIGVYGGLISIVFHFVTRH